MLLCVGLLTICTGMVQACVFTFENDSRVMVRVVDMDNPQTFFDILPYASKDLGRPDGHSNYHIKQKNGLSFASVYDLKMTGCAVPGTKPHVKFSGLPNDVPSIFTVVTHPLMIQGEILNKDTIRKSFYDAGAGQ